MNKKFKLVLNKEEYIALSEAMACYGQKLENDLEATNNKTEIHRISYIAETLYSVSSKIEQLAKEYSQFENST